MKLLPVVERLTPRFRWAHLRFNLVERLLADPLVAERVHDGHAAVGDVVGLQQEESRCAPASRTGPKSAPGAWWPSSVVGLEPLGACTRRTSRRRRAPAYPVASPSESPMSPSTPPGARSSPNPAGAQASCTRISSASIRATSVYRRRGSRKFSATASASPERSRTARPRPGVRRRRTDPPRRAR